MFAAECESSLYGVGELTSPNYPASYPLNLHCIWKISVDRGKSVQLTITDTDIEYTAGCRFDRLQIYDGRNRRAPLMTTICGMESGLTIVSKGKGKMLLEFI